MQNTTFFLTKNREDVCNMIKHKDEISLHEIIRTIIPKLWIILLISCIVMGLTFGYTKYIKKDTYTASFDIYIYKGDTSGGSPSLNDIQTAADMLETYEYILKTNKFLDGAIMQLPERYSSTLTADYVRKMISISAVGNTGALRISLTSTDPDFVLDLAKNFAPVIPNQVLHSIPNALKVSISEDPQHGPLAPNSKNVVRNSAVAFICTAVIMIALVWIIERFDTTIRDKKKIEDNIDIPILGAIPRHEVASFQGKE